MSPDTINIGILAHVDAGKTSLTERLLFDHGAIAELGDVSAGTTTTDSGELERQRGITIRAAVASFMVGDLLVNLIDTPGHPDFIAEVDRSLSVMDGAILVISAVDGVEPQTRVLMKSLARLNVPTAIFVNKIDLVGAQSDKVLDDIRIALRLRVMPLNTVQNIGSKEAAVVPVPGSPSERLLRRAVVLADQDEELLKFLVDGGTPTEDMVAKSLQAQTAHVMVHPVYFGSAVTGAGIAELSAGLAMLRKEIELTPDGEPHGRVFAIERGRRGEKIAYVRLYSGSIRERDRVQFSRHERNATSSSYETLITKLELVTPGHVDAARHPSVLTGGNIGRIIGSNSIMVGDYIGTAPVGRTMLNFSAPGLEAIVRPRAGTSTTGLAAALQRLAEEDPLIRARQVEGGAMALQLYGEVQKEVIAARLLRDFGVDAVFEKACPVYLERPSGVGRALHEMDHRKADANRFFATIGLLVEPAPVGSGIIYDNSEQTGHLPLGFHRAIEETVRSTLSQGLYGWEVTDCSVKLTAAGYASPVSTAADFRELTPLIIMEALREAGTRVYEPCHSFELEIPSSVFGAVLSRLRLLGADVSNFSDNEQMIVLEGGIPARCVQEFLESLPGLTRGQGVWSAYPGSDQPIHGKIPTKERTDGNPLNREEYMLHLSGRTVDRRRPSLVP